MRRREFIKVVAASAAAWPLAARAQRNRMRRVSLLVGLAEQDPEASARVKAFRCSRRSPRRPVTTKTRSCASCASRARRSATACRPGPRCSSASSSSSASSRRWGSPRTSSSCGTSCATRGHARHPRRSGPGSAAGSCVAYCLRIVDIDPIRYDLLFERFLNPGRKQMPDIDMDFDSRYRGEMIKYAAERYGCGPRRADRHVLHDQGAGRGARRGAGARLPVRGRRQDRQAHAAADHGPRHAAARVLRARSPKYEDGYKMAAELRDALRGRPRRASASSTSPRASRACAARTASTPPRW